MLCRHCTCLLVRGVPDGFEGGVDELCELVLCYWSVVGERCMCWNEQVEQSLGVFNSVCAAVILVLGYTVGAGVGAGKSVVVGRKGKLDEAEMVLRRLASDKVDVGKTLTVIVETDRLEQELEMGSTYWDCFRGVNLRRTEISMGVYCTQVLSGIYLINYGTYFFQLAGLDNDEAFDMGIGFKGKALSSLLVSLHCFMLKTHSSTAVGFLGTIISWPLLIRYGRRKIFNTGLLVLVVLQIIIGILDCIPGRPSGVIWTESSLMLVWNFFYDISVGPVCFVIISETSATRVRSNSIALATAAQGALGCVMTVAIPYMINPDQANMQGKLGFFFGGLAAMCLVWSYLRVPETSGRTYEELDILFERKVGAKQFQEYVIESEGVD